MYLPCIECVRHNIVRTTIFVHQFFILWQTYLAVRVCSLANTVKVVWVWPMSLRQKLFAMVPMSEIIGDFSDDPPVGANTVKELREAVKSLKRKRNEIINAYDERINRLEDAIEILNEGGLAQVGGEESSTYPLEKMETKPEREFPVDANLPEQIRYILRQAQEIMQPKQIDERLRPHVSDLRNTAVAESVSRMARKGQLHRQKYNDRSNYYGLQKWKESGSDDFRDEFKPDELKQKQANTFESID